jgi:hypothetical protein
MVCCILTAHYCIIFLRNEAENTSLKQLPVRVRDVRDDCDQRKRQMRKQYSLTWRPRAALLNVRAAWPLHWQHADYHVVTPHACHNQINGRYRPKGWQSIDTWPSLLLTRFPLPFRDFVRCSAAYNDKQLVCIT